MSNEIDKRIVEMEFRNGNFEKNANQSIDTMNRLDKSLNINGEGASKSLNKIGEAMSKLPIPGVAAGIESLSAKFSALQVVGVTALANITNSAVNAGKKIASALTIDPIRSGLSEYELKMDSTRVIMSSTGESIETVNKYLEELNEYSDRTIYSFADMTQNIGKFTNAGVKLEDAVMAIKGISNEAAVSGANANEASRAMYNFAQALSQGSVKLIDWKSIENANMATMEFKQQLIDTALEVGTLVKEGDKYISTTTDLTGNVSEAFNSTQMFNESLSAQWMTTDVLVKTLSRYADETTDIGKKSYEAAEEVTTLSKMVDTLKETAQSGWARTWEIIFGDIETAKKLFTPLTNAISEIIQKYDDFRNNLLEGALSKSPLAGLSEKLQSLKGETANVDGVTKSLAEMQDVVNRVWRGDYGLMQERWNLLDSEGYDSKVVQSLVNLGYQYSLTVDDVNNAYAKYGKLAPTVIKATNGLTTSIDNLNNEQLKNAGLTDDEIKQYRDLQKQSKETGKSISELISNMDGLSGRELLIGGLKNIGESLMNTFKALKDAWIDAFPPPTSTQLYNLIEGFNKFTEKIKITEEKAAKLERIFKGVFAVIDLVATIIGGPLKIAFKIITKVLGYFNLDILDVVAGVADAIVAFRDWVESLIDFDAIANHIGQAIEYVADAVKTWWDGFKNAPNKFKYVTDSMTAIVSGVATAISKWFDNLKNSDTIVGHILQGFSNGLIEGSKAVIETVKNFVLNIVDTVKSLLGIHSPSTVFFDIGKNIIEGLFNGLKWFVGQITDFARKTVDDIVGIFDSVPWDTIFAGASIASVIMVSRRLSKAAENMTSPLKSMSECIETVGKTIKTLGKSLKGYINAKKMEAYGTTFKSFATGLLILAGALWVMSTIDGKSLDKSVQILATLSALIIVLAFVFSKLQGLKPLSVLGVIIGLSLLLTKMAAVLVICSLLAPEKVKQGIITVTALTALLAGLMVLTKIMSVKNAYVVSKTMTSIAKVLIAMTLVMRVCGGMKKDEFIKGLVAIGVFSAIIVGLMAATKLMTSRDVAKAAGTFGSIGICLLLMAVACKIAGSMSMEEATVGVMVLTVMTLLVIALMAITRLLSSEGVKIGATMLALSASLMVMALSVKIAGSMSEEEVKNGLRVITVLAALVTLLMIAVRIFGSNSKCGGTILAMSIAIAVLAGVCILMGQMNPENMAKGLIAIGFLSLFVSMMLKASRGVEKCASTIIAIAVCVGILALVATALGLVPGEQLAKGIVALDAMMAGLAIVFASCKKLSKNKGTVIAITVAIAALAGCVWLLSTIEAEAAIRSTACMITLLTDFAICMKIIGKMGKVKKKTITTLATMTLVATALSGLIVLLSQCANPETALLTSSCLAVLLTDMTVCCAILSKSGKVNKKTIAAMAIMTAVVAGLAVIIGVMDALDVTGDIETVGSLVLLLEGLVGAVFVMSKIKNVSPGAVAQIMLVIAEVLGIAGLIFAAMAAIKESVDYFAGDGAYTDFMESGIDALCQLGRGIGEFVGELLGGIVGGIGNGIAQSLPAMGEALSKFMDNCQGFFDGIQNMPPNIGDAVGKLAGAMLAITATNLLSQMMAWFGGNNDMSSFSSGLVSLGYALKDFYESVKDLGTDAVKQIGICADVCVKLAEMAKTIPRQGGLWGDIFGENSLSTWAPGLVVLGENLVEFSKSVNSLSSGDLDRMEVASDTVKVLAEMANTIPRQGGLWGDVFGENNLDLWAPQLPTLGENLTKFADSISGLTDDDVDKMEIMTGVAKGLADMANVIPNEGNSFVSFFVGDNSLGQWAPELTKLGTHLYSFATAIRGINSADSERMSYMTDILAEIVEMSNQIPNEGGMVWLFTGDNTIDVWGSKLPAFGEYVAQFAANTAGITADGVTTASRAASIAKALVEAAKDVPNTGGLAQLFAGSQDLDDWGKQLPAFGTGIKGFADNVQGIKDVKNLNGIVNVAKALSELNEYAPNVGGVAQWFSGTTDLSKLGDGFGSLGNGLRAFGEAVTAGGSTTSSNVNKALDFTSTNVQSAVNIAQALSDVYAKINQESMFDTIVSWFAGDKLTNFSNSLEGLGASLGNFVKSFFATGAGAYTGQDGKTAQIMSVVDVIKTVTETLNGDMDSGEIYSASMAMDDFTTNVNQFFDDMLSIVSNNDSGDFDIAAKALDGLSKFIKDFDCSKANNCATSMTKLSEAVSTFKGTAKEDVEAFITAITSVGNLSTDTASAQAFEKLYANMEGVGRRIATSIGNGVKNNWAEVRNAITSALSTARGKMATAIDKFKSTGKALAINLRDGINQNADWVYLGLSSALTLACIKVNKSFYTQFKTVGSQLMQGMADGITAKKEDVVDAATRVAQAAVDSTKKTLDVHSPSRVFRSIGEYTGMGFVAGLREYQSASYQAGEVVSQKAVYGIASCLDQVQSLMDDEDMDWTPTVTPVLDLTQIQNGRKEMDALLSNGATASTTVASQISLMMSNRKMGVDNGDIVQAINDLNRRLDGLPHNTYNVNGVTYDDGTNVSDAVGQLINAIQVKRRT